jgi:hypothetical protein
MGEARIRTVPVATSPPVNMRPVSQVLPESEDEPRGFAVPRRTECGLADAEAQD